MSYCTCSIEQPHNKPIQQILTYKQGWQSSTLAVLLQEKHTISALLWMPLMGVVTHLATCYTVPDVTQRGDPLTFIWQLELWDWKIFCASLVIQVNCKQNCVIIEVD